MPMILQISDTHLSPRNGLFLGNVDRLRRLAEDMRPDLTVFSGDLSLDGADWEEDMAFAAELLHAFPGPAMFLPGNHDTGSHPFTMPKQPANEERMARFRRHFGAGHGLVDLPGWRIIGLNTEVMGTGIAEEATQHSFIMQAAAGIGDRRVALFLHKPVFVTRMDDPQIDIWSIPPSARPGLMPLLGHAGLRLVASGHLHMHHPTMVAGVPYVWSPALSFVMRPDEQDGLPGDRRCGVLLHHLGEDAVRTAFLVPDGVDTSWAADIAHLTYPA